MLPMSPGAPRLSHSRGSSLSSQAGGKLPLEPGSDVKPLAATLATTATLMGGATHKRKQMAAALMLFILFGTMYPLYTSTSHIDYGLLRAQIKEQLRWSGNWSRPSISRDEEVLDVGAARLFLPSSFAPIVLPPVTAEQLCDVCDCSDPEMPRYPDDERFDGPLQDESELATYIHSNLLDKMCNGVYFLRNVTGPDAPPHDLDAQSNLVHRARERLEDVLSWRLDGLRLGVPTAYVFTKTSAMARTGVKRVRYMARTAERLRQFRDDVNENGYADHTPGDERQFVWLVIEDGIQIEQEMSHMLSTTGLPYIYAAYGPTVHFGNAQHNLALGLIHALSRSESGALGHGPVVSVDDDGEVLPELFDMIWRVQRIGVWPMGNLGPTGWEGPEYDENGEIVAWPCWQEWRPFPVDNGAFAFHSKLLGTELPGPRFWPTDIDGGESEFFELLVERKEDIEPLCFNCHVAWHNEVMRLDFIAAPAVISVDQGQLKNVGTTNVPSAFTGDGNDGIAHLLTKEPTSKRGFTSI